jgi:dienelactone hydrolase
VSVALLAALAAGCATVLAGGEAPLERAWTTARVFRPAGPPGPRGVPVVVYAHGCAGLDHDDDLAGWAELLTRQGYAVIAPDHRARDGRRPACDTPALYERGDLAMLATREAEVAYALRQIRTLPWARPRAVFLLGFDHGAVVAAGYADEPFAGYILTGWTCTSPYPRGGLATALDRPVLAVRWEDDPRFTGPAWDGDCAASLGVRPASRSLVLEGSGHSTARSERARRAVVDFLQLHTPR